MSDVVDNGTGGAVPTLQAKTGAEVSPAGETSLAAEAEAEAVGPEGMVDKERVQYYRHLLGEWRRMVSSQAEANYHLAAHAAETVTAHLACAPGYAQRGTAIAEMARALVDDSDDSLFPPPGVKPERWQESQLAAAKKRVNTLLQVGAACRMLFGADRVRPVVTAKGPAKNASKAHPALPWGRVRELAPLVDRSNPAETCEEWVLKADVPDDKARALAGAVLSGIKREEIAAKVAELQGLPPKPAAKEKAKPAEDAKPGEKPITAVAGPEVTEEAPPAEEETADEVAKADRAGRGRRVEGRVVAVPLQRDGGEDPVRVAALLTDLLASLAGGADAALDALFNRLIRSADVKMSDGTRKVLRLAVAALGAPPRAIDRAMLALDAASRKEKEPEATAPVNGAAVAA
jgi:hypothetical protein